jgi:Insertion element 4 transposase N-terminal
MTRPDDSRNLPTPGPVDVQRLAGLQQFIGPDRLQQVLQQTGRRRRGHCQLTHEVMLWVVLAMGLLTDGPLREVFRDAAGVRPGQRLCGRAALCRARAWASPPGVDCSTRWSGHRPTPTARAVTTAAGTWSASTAPCWTCPTRRPTPASSVGPPAAAAPAPSRRCANGFLALRHLGRAAPMRTNLRSTILVKAWRKRWKEAHTITRAVPYSRKIGIMSTSEMPPGPGRNSQRPK